MRVFCLDVGQGDCTFVLPPDDAPAILFDCKDAHVARMFVRHHRIKKLSAIVFSHLDVDHIAGGQQFIEDFLTGGGVIDYVYIDPDRPLDDSKPDGKTAKKLIDFIRERGLAHDLQMLTPRAHPAEVDSARHDDWSVRIIGPRQETVTGMARGHLTEEPNVYSAVLRIEFGDKAVTIGGDAPLVSWAAMRPKDLPAAVFRIPHHGGALDGGGPAPGWSAQHLYDTIGPKMGVISVGTCNPYEHPHPHWVSPLLASAGCMTVCTQVTPRCEPELKSEDGVLAYRDKILRKRWAEDAAPAWRHRPDGRYRYDNPPRNEVPCAGTIEIVLREDGVWQRLPRAGSNHETATVRLFQRPWCKHGPPP
jgi:beta-lactamase superfamily II metal-dependent hydrolase